MLFRSPAPHGPLLDRTMRLRDAVTKVSKKEIGRRNSHLTPAQLDGMVGDPTAWVDTGGSIYYADTFGADTSLPATQVALSTIVGAAGLATASLAVAAIRCTGSAVMVWLVVETLTLEQPAR